MALPRDERPGHVREAFRCLLGGPPRVLSDPVLNLVLKPTGDTTMKIGFIGLGIMGRPWRCNLHDRAA